MVAVLPLLLYPAMGIGAMQLTVLFREQPRIVVVLGADHLPASPPLLDAHRFAARWFPPGADPNRLVVITDQVDRPFDEQLPDKLDAQALLAEAQAIRHELSEDRQRTGVLFGKSGVQVLVIVPDGFGSRLDQVEVDLAASQPDQTPVVTDYPRPEVVYSRADEKSQITFNRVTDVLERWESRILAGWLNQARLDPRFTHPVLDEPINVALDEQISASVWGRMFPALLVIMSVTGAFYPAIDMVAGEKERGTMETLLICPASRTEIVLGKFFAVMLFSCATALLNLVSLGFTGKYVASMVPAGALAQAGDIALPPISAIIWIVVLLLPLAALFSALCLALATFARSSKEGQYYLTPLLMATMALTMFCLSPGVELNPQYSLIPVAGVALLLKGLLLSPLHADKLYAYVPVVLVTSVGYSALALWWAIEQFRREEVLFREAERFDLALWLRHLWRDRQPTPGFNQALCCFGVILLMEFFTARFLQRSIFDSGTADRARALLRLLLIQQALVIALPALLMCRLLTTSFKETFGLRWPGWTTLGVAALLPVVLHPLSVEMLSRLRWFLGDLPAGAQEVLAGLSDPNLPIWQVLLVFAVAPALCEELAFRGFILNGFSRTSRRALAIGLSAVAFGLFHKIPQQVLNATLLGLVLGLLAVRSRSLFPAIVFHFVNNALGVVHARFGEAWFGSLPPNPFVSVEVEGVHYGWPTVLGCAVLGALVLRWVARSRGTPAASANGVSTSDGSVQSRQLDAPGSIRLVKPYE